MSKRSVLIASLAVLGSILLRCSDGPELNVRKSILPLKPGNYWIYQYKGTSPDGITDISPHLDSVRIEGDTLIDNKKYWIQIGSLSGTVYLRDSADCVLMLQLTYEQIIYSTNRDTLERNPPVYKLVTDINEMTEVPAGRFPTLNCRVLVRKDALEPGHAHYPSYDDNFYTSTQYISSPMVGLVKREEYYLGGTLEYELIRYKVN